MAWLDGIGIGEMAARTAPPGDPGALEGEGSSRDSRRVCRTRAKLLFNRQRSRPKPGTRRTRRTQCHEDLRVLLTR